MHIYKYTIPHRAKPVVTLPIGTKILSAGMQVDNETGTEEIRVWAGVPNIDSDEFTTTDVKFAVVGTGSEAPKGYTFIDTVKLQGGSIILHVFFDSSAPVSKA